MARFYKTASTNPLEYMYRINTPLMAQVIKANDQYIDENLTQLNQLGTAAVFPYLQIDEQRVKAITDEYTKKIDDLTNTIKSDPANWRDHLGTITNVAKDLQTNYRTGEISKIVDNYGKYKTTSDYIDEQVKEFGKTGKGISADRAKAYKKMFLSDFIKANPKGTSYDASTGEYNSINVFDPMNNIDVRKTLSDEIEKMKADGSIRITDQTTGAGEYFNKETREWEGITPERILRIATSRLNDPQLMNYLRQDTQAGVVSGVFDNDPDSPNYGQFIAPYNYDKVGLSLSEQSIIDNIKKQINQTKDKNTKELLQTQLDNYTNQLNNRKQLNWNQKSYLAPIMQGIVDQYSYSKTKEESDISANPIWQTRFTQAQTNARNTANIQASKDRQEAGFQHAKQLQDERLAAQKELKLLEWANKPTKAGTKSTKTGTIPKTDNSVVGTLYTSPYYWTTEDKNKMTTSLNDEVNTSKGIINQLENTLANLQKNSPDDKLLIASAENQLASARAKLNTLEAQRNLAIDYAMNEWKSKGVQSRPGAVRRLFGANVPIDYNEQGEKSVREYLSGKLKTDYDNANAEYQKLEVAKAKLGNDPQWLRNTYYPARKRKADTEAIYNSTRELFEQEIKPLSDDKLEKAAKETTNSNAIVSTTDNQDQFIATMINASPSNYKVRNSDGREINLSFEHGTATTDPSKFKINGVSATTGLGDKGVEISATVNGKHVIITPKDDEGRMEAYLADQFKKSKDKEVQAIGSTLSNPTAGIVSDMMTEMRMNTNSGANTAGNWVYKNIQNPANPNEIIKLRARPISTGTGSEPKWEFQFETTNPKLITSNAGKGNGYKLDAQGNMIGYVPLISTRSQDGIYHNFEDIISIFPD